MPFGLGGQVIGGKTYTRRSPYYGAVMKVAMSAHTPKPVYRRIKSTARSMYGPQRIVDPELGYVKIRKKKAKKSLTKKMKRKLRHYPPGIQRITASAALRRGERPASPEY